MKKIKQKTVQQKKEELSENEMKNISGGTGATTQPSGPLPRIRSPKTTQIASPSDMRPEEDIPRFER